MLRRVDAWYGGLGGGTNHLVLQDVILLVDFGTFHSVASGHEVVKFFFREPLCSEVRARKA